MTSRNRSIMVLSPRALKWYASAVSQCALRLRQRKNHDRSPPARGLRSARRLSCGACTHLCPDRNPVARAEGRKRGTDEDDRRSVQAKGVRVADRAQFEWRQALGPDARARRHEI